MAKLGLDGYELTYDESIEEYMIISNAFNKKAETLLQDMDLAYASYKDMHTIHEKYFDYGYNLLLNVSKSALEFCAKAGIYDIDEKFFLQAKNYGSSAIDIWDNKFSIVDSLYCNIINIAKSEKEYRELRKNTRGRVIGGGFGLKGAAVGMLQAGAINMLTGAAHSVFNSFGDSSSDKKSFQSQEELYKDKRTLNTLKIGMASSIDIIKKELCNVLNIKPFPKDAESKAGVIIGNIKKGVIPEDKIKNALLEVFVLNPFSTEAYRIYLRTSGDREKKLDEFAAFFELDSFLKYEKTVILKELLDVMVKNENVLFDSDKFSNILFNSLTEGISIIRLLGSRDKETIQTYIDNLKAASAFLGIETSSTINELLKLTESTGNTEQEKIIIPDNIKVIPDYAYFKFKKLNNVQIPEGVTAIGDYAFAECEELKTLKLPSTLQKIGKGSFSGCAFEEIILPDSLTEIGSEAFAFCKIKHITIPEGVIELGDYIFRNTWGMQSITLPDSLERIGNDIFANSKHNFVICNPGTTAHRYCKENNVMRTSIFSEKDAEKINVGGFDASYIIPDKYTSIDDHAFEGVKKLKEITIPPSIKTIGEYAFVGLKLKKVQFSNGLIKIGESAFADCCDIETITLPNSVREIGSHAFYGCEKLKEVYLSDSLISLGSKAFANCKKLKKVQFSNANGLIKIEEETFADCYDIETITLPNSIKEIASLAFWRCRKLRKVDLPNNLVNLGFKAFADCDKLERITLPDSLQKIEEHVFYSFETRNINLLAICNSGTVAHKYCQENNIRIKTLEAECYNGSFTVFAIDEYKKLADKPFGKSFWSIEENIPAKKLNAAQSNYLRYVNKNESLLFYFDDTLFGNGTEGFAITDQFIYSDEFKPIKLTEITNVSNHEELSKLILETERQSSVTSIICLDPKNRGIFLIFLRKLIFDFNHAKNDNNIQTRSADDYKNSGNTYYEKCQYDLAIADYSKAIELNPKNADYYSNRGGAYAQKNQYDLAIADYSKAIELKSQHGDVYYSNRGYVYKKKGQYDLAIADYSNAIELSPQNADYYNSRGIAYVEKDQYDLAIADYSKAIELKPQDAYYYNNRGDAYAQKNQHDLAIVDFGKAIELNPQDADYYNHRGGTYVKKGQYDLAIADYSKAIELKPQNERAYINCGLVYQMKGVKDQAKLYFEKALSLNPQSKLAAELLSEYTQVQSQPQSIQSVTVVSDENKKPTVNLADENITEKKSLPVNPQSKLTADSPSECAQVQPDSQPQSIQPVTRVLDENKNSVNLVNETMTEEKETLFKKFCSFKWRINRKAFILRLLGIYAISMILLFLVPVLCFILLIPLVSLTVRRGYDLNRNWLTTIIMLMIPYVNALYFLYLIFAKGSDEPNKYGEPFTKW